MSSAGKSVVLVHGGFVDGAGWKGVYDILKDDGYDVAVVQNPTLDKERFHESFAGDVPADEAAFMADSQVPWGLDALGGPVTEPAWRSKPSRYLVVTDDRMIPRSRSGRWPSAPGRR